MRPIWNDQEICVAKRGDKGQGRIKRNVYLDGRVREAGELFSFEIIRIPDNEFQVQYITIKSEVNLVSGTYLYPWYLTNTEILP